ncbi:hypothetical protein MYK68_14110 [Gordonia sp. PP30]|uniref:hypothetical protein n=1 Tax=Gordonia sp. PP30 TaxID=2935861 RepID=UPI001FFFEA8E|nr:hypothetical protein [Gordonia sp. PP30]UQE73865.1 hypothetical protein MYK68_14110 [Gordonia sp. PP30]
MTEQNPVTAELDGLTALGSAITACCQRLDAHLAHQTAGATPVLSAAGEADLTPVATELTVLRTLTDMIKALSDVAGPMKTRVQDAMGDADTGVLDGRPAVTWKPVKSRRFDQKAFKAVHPQLVAEFTIVTESRRFTVVD